MAAPFFIYGPRLLFCEICIKKHPVTDKFAQFDFLFY